MHFRRISYGDHPYGIVIPSEGDIQKITRQDVKDDYGANFCAQRAHIYVAGRFDGAAVKKAINERFGGWEKGKPRVPNVPVGKTAACAGGDRPAGGTTIDVDRGCRWLRRTAQTRFRSR
jgi:predicted Zn-dependent peptidase